MKRALIIVLTTILLLVCGCAKAPVTETVPQTEPTTEPTQATTQAATTAKKKYYNPLTGEQIKKATKNRAFAVVFNNSKAAMPQHGISQADIFYEMLIEGETRCMGVFYNLSEATQTLGSIRSARRDFIRLAMAYDAIYVHNGRSPRQGSAYDKYSAEVYFEETGWDHIDGNDESYANSYYYRTRKDSYALEHTMFINPGSAIQCATDLGCTMTRSKSLNVGLKFSKKVSLKGDTAEQITIWFNQVAAFDRYWNKSTTMTYNAKTGKYEASQKHGGYRDTELYVDGNTGDVLSFENVLVLHAPTERLGNSNGWMKIEVVGEGTGYFACNGKIVPIKWSRPTESDPYTYTLENGKAVTLGVGKTYIAVIPEPGLVEYQ